MKRLINTCIVALLCISLAACSSISADISKIDKEETYPQSTGSLAKIFTSFDEIVESAEYITEIEVLETEVEMINEIPQTHSKVKIADVRKGNLNVGDMIEVVELGGVTKDHGEFIAGVPALKKGQKLVLFLTFAEGVYWIEGAFQGKFIEREGYLFQQATEDVKLKDYSPKEIKDFKDTVKKSVDRLEKDKRNN